MSNILATIWRTLSRRNMPYNPGNDGRRVHRCLSIVDVTCLGLASVLGIGLYCLMGEAARSHAGPAIVLSYLLAAVSSFLVGLCYSELATRFPLGGSAYIYTYATTGEFCAFVIGWSMVLEYTLGAALAAKSWSQYIDVVTNGSLFRSLNQPIGVVGIPGFDSNPDVPAVLVILIMSLGFIGKVKFSCTINNVLIFVDLLILVGIVLVGLFNMDSKNWTAGTGFFPHGVSGVLTGSSLCSFAFIGFDIIATSTREMENRSTVLPGAVNMTFLIGLVTSFITASAITLVVPSSLLEKRGSLLQAFNIRKIRGINAFVIIGANCGLMSSLWACLFALSRILHNLANDGFLFSFLKRNNDITGTNWCASLTSSFLSAFIAFFCDSSSLLKMLGMGTLVAFCSVAVSVLCLHYGVAECLPLEQRELSQESTLTLSLGGIVEQYLNQVNSSTQTSSSYFNSFTEDLPAASYALENESKESSANKAVGPSDEKSEEVSVMLSGISREYGALLPKTTSVEFVNESYITSVSDLTSLSYQKQEPTQKSTTYFSILLSTTFIIMTVLGLLTMHTFSLAHENWWWLKVVVSVIFVGILMCGWLLLKRPHPCTRWKNDAPCVPVLPVCAIWIFIHLITCLPYIAWATFSVWTLIGILIYVSYGVWHTTESNFDSREVALLDVMNEEVANPERN
ncbi:high affinity cationic amino acid transporter 1-like [Tachypleus tridentatus]|uniref:high affinity cationic amino acid transporter 1-like n=1 Tax=Tachypleus tridentatus TaxID=6853 RepID=UPI003FD15213